MLEYSEVISQLRSSRDKAFVIKFYIERKSEDEIMRELYIDSRQTLRRMKKKIRMVIEKTYGKCKGFAELQAS